MTDIRSERILSYIETALAGTTQVGANISRDPGEAITRDKTPALVIEDGGETHDLTTNTNFIQHAMTVKVSVITRGANPATLAAPIRADVHHKLMADQTLGGLTQDVMPIRTDFQVVPGDQIIGIATLYFLVRFRTTATDLTT